MPILRTPESTIGIEAISRTSNTLFAKICRWLGVTICERVFLTSRQHAICGVWIPKGFVFDGASIPGFMRIYCNPRNFLVAALVHDYLYSLLRAERLPLWECMTGPQRLEADRIFARAVVEEDHRSLVGALVLYAGLRIGGWSAVWNRRKRC